MVGSFLFPDFQIFWVGDLFYRSGATLSGAYVLNSAIYALFYVLVFLSLGSWAFRRKSL